MRRRGTAGPARAQLALNWIWPGVVLGIALVMVGLGSTTASGQQPASVTGEAEAPPEFCTFPSRTGEVSFPHQMHFEDFEMACTDCHHEVNAGRLRSPHPEYFADFWINCSDCHTGETEPMTAKNCGVCHQQSYEIADQTISSKVAIHSVCSECHEIGTGAAASESCQFCHSGPKSPW